MTGGYLFFPSQMVGVIHVCVCVYVYLCSCVLPKVDSKASSVVIIFFVVGNG